LILLDYSQVALSNIMQNLTSPESSGLEEDLVKHMILNSIRSYLVKYGLQYGKLIICCDSKSYWRKDVFPYYKQGRKAARDDSTFDWDKIFKLIHETKSILKEHFPYMVLEVPGAEADDIIAVLARYGSNQSEPVLVISGDHDFSQLQKYKGVNQYAPIQKKEIKITNPKEFLIEHIIQGDKGDGIPNFLSQDDSFVNGIRQKSIMSKKLVEWVKQTRDEICTTDEMRKNWDRNQQLVDFDFIPKDVISDIMKAFDTYSIEDKTKKNIYDYMLAAKMRQLVSYIDDFMVGQDKKQSIASLFE